MKTVKDQIETLNCLHTLLETDKGLEAMKAMGIIATRVTDHKARLRDIIEVLESVKRINKFL